MTKKEISEAIAAKIASGEDRPRAIAAEILHEYRDRRLPAIEEEAERALRPVVAARQAKEAARVEKQREEERAAAEERRKVRAAEAKTRTAERKAMRAGGKRTEVEG